MTEIIAAVVDLARDHSGIAAFLVFTTAFLEAIVIVGLFIPGTSILIGVGAALAFGGLPLWPVVLWAAAGAITGNTISYYLGRRHKQVVLAAWPFTARPELWARTEDFLQRHGLKSIAIGRFLPVIRPLIPFAAGAAGVNPLRFQIVNVTSACLWAPAFILPGAAGGWSLARLAVVSKRGVVLLLLLAGCAALTAWFLRFVWSRVAPALARRMATLATVAEIRSGGAWALVRFLVAPAHGSRRTSLILAGAVLACWWLLAALVEDVLERGALLRADAAASAGLQQLRTTAADAVFKTATLLGDTAVAAAVSSAVVVYLLCRKAYRAAAAVAALMVTCAVFVPLAKLSLKISRPTPLYDGFDAFSFPSGHATAAAALYGVLSWLVLRGRPSRLQPVAIALFATAITTIAFSRVYLAAHWPSDAAAGLLIGLSLTLVCALALRTVDLDRVNTAGLLLTTVAALIVFGGWHVRQNWMLADRMYAAHSSEIALSPDTWRTEPSLPAQRIDLAGDLEEPFSLAWAGPPEELVAVLARDGWRPAKSWNLPGSIGVFRRETPPTSLPVMPVLHNGGRASLTMVRADADGSRQIVRAWSSPFHLAVAADCRVWLVSVVEQPSEPWFGGLRRLEDEQDEVASAGPAAREASQACQAP